MLFTTAAAAFLRRCVVCTVHARDRHHKYASHSVNNIRDTRALLYLLPILRQREGGKGTRFIRQRPTTTAEADPID